MSKRGYIILSIVIVAVVISTAAILPIYQSIERGKAAKSALSRTEVVSVLTMDSVRMDISLKDGPVLLIFYNSTCDVCHDQLQEIQEKRDRLPRGLKIYAITNEPAIDASIADPEFTYLRAATESDCFALFNIQSVPTIMLFSQQKSPVKLIGFKHCEEILQVF